MSSSSRPRPWSRSGKACSSEHACRVCLSYHGSSGRYGHTCAYRPASCVGQRYGPHTQKVCSPRVPLRVLPLFTGASCNMSRDRACWSTAYISMPWTHAMLMRLSDKQETEASSAPAHKRAQAEHSPTHLSSSLRLCLPSHQSCQMREEREEKEDEKEERKTERLCIE